MIKRVHTISVRMNIDELHRLNELRGKIRRGTYLRMLFNGSAPAMVPELNRGAYSALARSASNLNQIARHLNIDEHVEVQDALNALRDFRLSLLV